MSEQPEPGPEIGTRAKKRPAASPCGWCAPGHNQLDGCRDAGRLCHGTYKDAVPASVNPDRTWVCPCAEAGHPGREELKESGS